MAEYDIGEAFQRIEEEMISSMSRNLRRHLNPEEEEGINYAMWQAEQLSALNDFKLNNPKQFGGYFSTINEKLEEVLRKANESGKMSQEAEILEAIRAGWKASKPGAHLQGSFFKINERKLNALVKATKKDMIKAEHAMLRKANDEYRKIIFNSEAYYNTGAGTLQQCVDMASKDFLSKGIACIEYANGARVGIDSYARMALRTSQTRAYLQGESEKRDEWGVNTVLVNKRGVACPKCLQWVGRVYYDDVWGNVPVTGDKYPRLSEAIAGGLYHPNCKDSHTTFFEGVSTVPAPMTQAQVDKANRVYALEQRQRYNERQIRKYKRLSQGSVDPDNKDKYEAKLTAWQNEQKAFVKANKDVLKQRSELEKVFQLPDDFKEAPIKKAAPNPVEKVFKPAESIQEAEDFIKKYVDDSKFGAVGVSYKGLSLDVANEVNRTIGNLADEFGGEKFGGIIAPKTNTALGKKLGNSYAAYSPARNSFILNKNSLKDVKTFEKTFQAERDCLEGILKHPEKYDFSKLSSRTRSVIEHSHKSGRHIVPETIEEVISHEFGHSLEKRVMASDFWEQAKQNIATFADNISGYASSDYGEYIAESFASYRKGEDVIDPIMRKIFEGMKKK